MKTILPILSCLALALAGCNSTGNLAPGVATGVTIGTSLAVNAYPAAAPLVEMFSGAIRAATAKGPVTPAALSSFLALYAPAGEAFAANLSKSGSSDVARFVAAINARYAAAYPAIVKGDMSVEQFAQAVEAGA